MAEKAEKKSEAAPADAGESKEKTKGGLLTKLPVLLGGVMVIEAAVFLLGYVVFKPKPPLAAGAQLIAADGGGDNGSARKGRTAEVAVGDYKALNRTNGRTFLYDLSIYVVVKSENEQKVTDAFKDGKALIEDRIRTIIAESDPDKLGGGSEPGLETLRRQVKYQLDRIVGDGLIDEVLVPRCIPFRTDY